LNSHFFLFHSSKFARKCTTDREKRFDSAKRTHEQTQRERERERNGTSTLQVLPLKGENNNNNSNNNNKKKNLLWRIESIIMSDKSAKKKKGGGKSTLEETLKKYRKGEKAAAKIMIEVARDRAALDARSEAQQERVRRQAEQERQRQEEKLKKANAKLLKEREAALAASQAGGHQQQQVIHVPTSLLARQKATIDCLKRTREQMTNSELKALLGFDTHLDKQSELFLTLKANEKIFYDEKKDTLKYKPKFDIRNKNELLGLILKHMDGVLEEDLGDSYDGVLVDAMKLEESGKVWRVQNSETRKWVTYPRVNVMEDDGADNNKEGVEEEEENINKELIDEEFVKMYTEVKIPDEDAEFDKELRKVNMEPAAKRSFRKVSREELEAEKKLMKKKKRAPNFERMKLTNVHMKDLFKGDAPDALV
jgi:transcription initiation factor TFIIE subunit beta